MIWEGNKVISKDGFEARVGTVEYRDTFTQDRIVCSGWPVYEVKLSFAEKATKIWSYLPLDLTFT
jgi:hypothetical protein